jgi:hypothetical protein
VRQPMLNQEGEIVASDCVDNHLFVPNETMGIKSGNI